MMAHKEQSRADLELRNLSVILGGRQILKDQSLKASSGEIICITGPSGCGKTTLLRAIARLQTAQSGELRVGQSTYDLTSDIDKILEASFYPAVCYVPQTLALWPHFSNYENIKLPLNANEQWASTIKNLASQLGVEQVLSKNPANCSQGQRQRIALIRALILKPQLLLLDEITSALDRDNSERVAVLLREFTKAGRIIIAVTHDLRFAQSIANRIIEFDLSGEQLTSQGIIHEQS